MHRIALSLAGHTNLGKTTLARTLLRRDIGTVEDRPHVTDVADGHVLIGDAGGEIVLWDLPGFGDSVKLLRRLKGGSLLDWLKSVFDRWADRPLWCSQQCVRNARDDADVVLYLVDAQADPGASPEVMAEMEILGWVGKPVVILLNQTGLPDSQRDEALAARWSAALAGNAMMRGALPLDGWMRCWVQEIQVLRHIEPLVPEEKRGTYRRLVDEWANRRHRSIFDRAVALLAEGLAASAMDGIPVEGESFWNKISGPFLRKLSPQNEKAKQQLLERLVDRSRRTMEALLALHEIEGVPRQRVESLIDDLKQKDPSAPPEFWAMLGSVGAGALGGLIADLHAGGATFLGGAVIGALVGGCGAYAFGYGFRRFEGAVRWRIEFLLDEWRAWAMRYLFVAHFGRGQGRWDEPLPSAWPSRWLMMIDEWTRRHHGEVKAALAESDAPQIHSLLGSMLREVLDKLYPTSIANLRPCP